MGDSECRYNVTSEAFRSVGGVGNQILFLFLKMSPSFVRSFRYEANVRQPLRPPSQFTSRKSISCPLVLVFLPGWGHSAQSVLLALALC